MAEHFLNRPEIGTSLDHMGGKRVPEGMGTDLFYDSCLAGKGPDYCEYHGPSKFPSSPVQEYHILTMDSR
jgi:hypothetical protein